MSNDNEIDLSLVRAAWEALCQGSFHHALEYLARFLRDRPVITEGQALLQARWRIKEHYKNEVHGDADSFANRWREGEFSSQNEVFDALNALAPENNHLCLFSSRHEDAYYDEWAEAPPDLDAMARAAFKADVIDALSDNYDIDVYSRPPREGEIKCDICCEWSKGTGDTCDSCRGDEEEEETPPCES